MKVAVIVGRFPNLSETFVINQITGLLDRGHSVDIYAEPPEQASAHEDVERYGLRDRTRYSPRMPRNLLVRLFKAVLLLTTHAWKDPRRLLGALNVARYGRAAASLRLLFAVIPFVGRPTAHYDVLHCHFGGYGLRALFLRDVGALSGHLVTTFHGADLARAGRDRGYAELLQRGELFLPISDAWRQRLLALGCPTERVRVHRMGIACSRFAFRPRMPPAAGPVRFVSVCRLVEKKGIEYAIRAIGLLAASGRSVRYDVIGDGPLRPALERLIDEQRLAGTVTLHGWKIQGEVLAMLRCAHAFLAPSVRASNGDHEGIPVALMEAMASGLPVVSTRHGGIPELVDDGANGLLANERDAVGLAERAAWLLDHPPRWPALAAAARAKVERCYDVERLNDRLVELFREFRSGAGARPARLVAAPVDISTNRAG